MSFRCFSRLLQKLTNYLQFLTSPRHNITRKRNDDVRITAKDLQEVFTQKNTPISLPCCEKIVEIHMNMITHEFKVMTVEYLITNCLGTFNKFEQDGIVPEARLAKALEYNSPYKHNWSSGFLGRLIEAADPHQKKGINNEQFIVLREGIASFLSNQRWLPSNLPVPTQERIESFVIDLVSSEVFPDGFSMM